MTTFNKIVSANPAARAKIFVEALGFDMNLVDITRFNVEVEDGQAIMTTNNGVRTGMSYWAELDISFTLDADDNVVVDADVYYETWDDYTHEEEKSDKRHIHFFKGRKWDGCREEGLSWLYTLEDPMTIVGDEGSVDFLYVNESCPFRY